MKKSGQSLALGIVALGAAAWITAHADTLPTVPTKHKVSDTQWKNQTVRTVETLSPLPPEPAEDRFGGRMDRSAAKTGFFYARKIGDRWWLVDPDGHLDLHVGVVNVSPGPDPADQQNPQTWAQDATHLLQGNGFNSVGAWSATSLLRAEAAPLVYTIIGHSGLPGTRNTNGFMSAFAGARHISSHGTGHSNYPNDCIPVFHPEFAAFCDDYAKPLAAFKDDPYLMGYFSDNELPMPVLDKYLSLDPKDPQMGSSYQAAKAWLDTRKGSDATPADVTDADRDAWTEYVFDRYFTLTTGAIRKYDPHHMCLGPRLNSRSASSEPVFRAAGRSLDAIAINYYGVWNPSLPSVIRRTEWAGKPILISEFYAKGMDAGFANTGGAGWVVPTQRDRGLFYQTFTLGLLESKTCIGWDWFKYADNDPSNKSADPSNRDSNKGIVTLTNAPYTPLLEQMRTLNRNIYAVTDAFDRSAGGTSKENE